ncbi:hypothetical protein NIES2119_09890 [[Phormidium ambiguum] IAM M-71]|uniref:Uncharacterized protein n=1 Tax=[Phormidium ambiguum] IAM M-71 TaxID=454136 RepID=A0A1U7IM93_9CYAN|nr:hypothetical protein [Phormidium ambiguum]OKH38338.1 hypothetical protein NIES2119_09890 [Phormidium ambiguum IAM M-71]
MHIEKIYYRLKSDLRDGASEEITLVGIPAEDESTAYCVERLRTIAQESKLPNKWQVLEEIKDKVNTIRTLDTRIADRTKVWNELAHFLRTQGVNPDIPNAPLSLPGLPQQIDGEIVEVKDDF